MSEPPAKRFKYASYNAKLKDISVNKGKGKAVGWGDAEFEEEEGHATPFTSELARLGLHELTLPYQKLSRDLYPLTPTLPITLLNLQPISDIFSAFFANLKDGQDHLNSGLDSALSLVQALYATCLGEAAPFLPSTAKDLLRTGKLRALEPRLIEKSFSTLSEVLRQVAGTILKPEADQLLRQTWSEITPYLRPKDNKRYVRRCVADAWVAIIRKARGEGLRRLIGIMLEEDHQGMEAVWAHSVKGGPKQLHSRAIPILDTLLDDLRDNPTASKDETMILVITSVCHHCSSTNLGPVIQNLLDRLDQPSSTSSSRTPLAAAQIHIFALLSTLLFTRKGKRYPETLLKPTMQKLLSLAQGLAAENEGMDEAWSKAYLRTVIAVFMASKLEQWLSPGVMLIEKIWKSLSNSDAFEFATALVVLKWPGVEQFLLPHIARSTTDALSVDPLATILLLNTLRDYGYLASGLSNVQGGRWRTTMTTNITSLLQRLSLSVVSMDDRRLLGQVLHLVPALGDLVTFEPYLANIIKHSLQSRLTQAEWMEAGVWNDAHLLAAVLRCVDEVSHTAVGERLRLAVLSEKPAAELVDVWSWSREVMEQLAPILEMPLETKHALNAGKFETNLLSADSVLRRSSLRILAAASGSPSDESSEHTTPADVWASCLKVENAEMSLRNSREKPTEIARLGRLLLALPVETSEEMQQTFFLALRYLLAQLKVNYRPVYPETIKWFSQLASNRGEAIWDLVWQELQRTHSASALSLPDFNTAVPDWARSAGSSQEGRVVQDEEDEAEFRCPNLERQNVAVTTALAGSSDVALLDEDEIKVQISHDRLDVLNYEAQLLAVLGSIVSLAEKHTRVLIPMFFEVAGHDDSDDQSLSTRQRQQRTANFLTLLAKFVNPKAAFRTDELRQVYLNILAKGDNNLQKLALDCLLTYKSPSLVLYQANLKALLEESKFRDELVHFQLGQDMGIIDPLHRAEAIPVTIRLLYGIITARRGRTSAHGLAGRKQAVLTSMSGCSSEELGTLVDLMLEPFDELSADSERHAVGRQQLGFLSLLQDVLRYLGPQTEAHWPRMLKTTIELVGHAQAVIGKEAMVVEEEEDEEDEIEPENGSAPLRNIRSTGIKRIVQFLRSKVDFDFNDYLPGIFAAAISPRLDKLEIENTQAPSGTLEIIAAIAAVAQTAPSLNALDSRTLPKTFACLVAVKVKPAVIARVFDVIESLLSPIHDDPPASPTVLLPNMRMLLESIIQLVPNLKTGGNDDLMRRLLGILSSLSTIVTDGQQAQQLATLLSPLLRQPTKQLSEKAKLNILLTLQRLFAISPDFADPQSTFFTQNYEQICNLLQILFFPNSRRALISLLDVFAQVDSSIRDVIRVVGEINAYSARRLEEPDFDRRLTAFGEINELPLDQLYTTRRQWLPLIRASLFFIREPDELSIRTSASSVIQRFLSVIGDSTEGELVDTFLFVVLPSLKQTLRSKLELVRNETLTVLSFAVKTCTGIPVMADLQPLLGSGDEEVNFFTNMTHIQVHRRTRAIHRLRDLCEQGQISESAVSTIFVPLLEHNITGATDVTDHHLTNEAILAIGTLAGILRWSRYSATIMRYLRLGTGKSAQQKFYIRTVSSIIDNFKFDLKSQAVVDVGEVVEEEEDAEVVPAESGPDRAVITQVVLTRLLPALSRFVEHKDETDDNIRIPVALGIVKIASALPGDSSGNEVLRIITTASQILRSKDQDTRDLARETICKIAIYLGPDWLVRVLKELRDALQRGPQKHVLAVTTHAILVQATSDAEDRFSDLDAAVQDAVEVSAEVVWGESGRDVESDGFKTKMREVKGAMTRGYDTFQLVSRLASPAKVSTILAPLRDVMHASQSVKIMLQVDEALRRIALGLNANAQLGAKDLLNLCFSLVSGNSAYLKSKKKAKTTRGDRFSVQMKRDDKKVEDYYPLNAPKFVAFGLDLFVTAFRRGKFDFEDVDILARLGPLVSAIGNTLYSTHSNVPLLGLKATAAIARCPLPQLEDALPVYVTNIFRILKLAGGTAESDLAQTALKTLAVLLRDCRSATITDSQLKYLLEVVSPDLEEADRQGAIFAVLRSVVARNFVVPEVYDLMDRISSIMVTSQSANVQEQCRSVLIQFLLDYPQGSGRLKNQMTFLAQNLDYIYQSGRISVMELLSAVFSKFSDDIIQEYADLFFVALVMVLANDDSEKCRTVAGALVKQLVERVDEQHRVRIVEILKSWVERRKEHTALGGAALSVFGLLTGSTQVGAEVVDTALEIVTPIMAECAAALAAAEDDSDDVVLDHQLPHQALVTLAKILRVKDGVSPDLPWAGIIDMLLFPHDWVRFDAARVITTVLTKPGGFELFDDDQLLDVARKSCLLLKGGKDADGEETVVDAKLADEVVKLLWNVAKHWATTQPVDSIEADDDDQAKPDGKQPLPWLMSRTSFLARRLIIDRPSSHIAYLKTEWTRPVTSIFRFFAGVYDILSEQQAKQFCRHALAPVYRILDDGGDLANMEDDEAIDNLRLLATEVRDFVQNKIGPTDFSQVWESLRKKVRETREGRREEKNRMAVADPQAWADRKGKRGEMKKESKKRKVKAFADAKQRERPVKRRA